MRVLIRVALLLASVALSLVTIEVCLRNFYPQYGGCDYREPDAELDFTLKANHTGTCIMQGHESVTEVGTNALGLRNPSVVVPKPPGVHRIMVVGDSTTFGFGVARDESMPALLQDILRSRDSVGAAYEVVNAGVPGYGTAQEWILYKRLAASVDPEVVVLAFLITNDVQDNLCEDGRPVPCFAVSERGTLVGVVRPPASAPAPSPSWTSLFDVSAMHSWVLLRTRLSHFAIENVYVAGLLARTGWFGKRPLPTTLAAWYETPRSTEGWALTRALLDEFVRDVAADNRKFLLAVLPARPQTTPEIAALQEALYGNRPEGMAYRADPERPQQWLNRWATEAHVAMVDLLPPLRKAGATTRLNLDEGHFNGAGNAVIADALAGALVDCCLPGARAAGSMSD